MLLAAICWRSRRWLLVSVPLGLTAGLALAAATHWYIKDQGLAEDRAPVALWVWIGATGLAATVTALGWRGARWWRRGVSLVAVPMCALSALLILNSWTGYVPTVGSAWARATGRPLPGLIDRAGVAALQRQGAAPDWKTIVKVHIPDDASGFAHRDELVILPPAWYASVPPPRLPVVMMIGGEFGQPADWLYAGNAQQTINDFAAAHGGNAPVLVFPDYSGAFSNDTECVNGTRGNAADHLTKDVVPYMIANFGVSADAADWGVVGWSSGGTCALTLAVAPSAVLRTRRQRRRVRSRRGDQTADLRAHFRRGRRCMGGLRSADGDRQSRAVQEHVGVVLGLRRDANRVPPSGRHRADGAE
jgi:S-formylglutathione hydrolase FrmB